MIIPQPLQLKIIERLGEADKCTRCQSTNRSLGSRLYRLSEYRPEPPPPFVEVPLVVVTCNNCGSMELFSAITLDVVDPQTGGLKNA
jgi:hypothetical protein